MNDFEQALQEATDGWLVRWTLAGRTYKLSWDMLQTIPVAVLDAEIPRTLMSFHVTNAYAAVWRGDKGYVLLLTRIAANACSQITLPVDVHVFDEWSTPLVHGYREYHSSCFESLRKVLRQIPEPRP